MDLPDFDAPSLSDAQIWILKIWQKTFSPTREFKRKDFGWKNPKKQQDSFTNTFVEVLQKPTTWVPQNFF